MKLIDLSPSERESLALKLGIEPKYLYQLAAGSVDVKTGKPRRITAEMAREAVKHDPRLTLHELRPDIWDAPEQPDQRTEMPVTRALIDAAPEAVQAKVIEEIKAVKKGRAPKEPADTAVRAA